MNWDALGAIGEILGAVAVVATLFYLSRQIRQNSQALDRSTEYERANSFHQTNLHYGQVFAPLARDAELASIYRRALAGESLDETDSVRFQAFVNTFCAWLEDYYLQARTHLSTDELEEGGVENLITAVGPYLARLLRTEAGRTWWEGDAACLFTTTFREAANSVVVEGRTASPAI